MDTATVLEEAADLLLIRGVCRDGTYGAPGRARCVIGAISEVSGVAPPMTHLSPEVTHLRRHLFPGSSLGADPSVTTWNDASTDDFEVIDTLRHCAKDIRNGASA